MNISDITSHGRPEPTRYDRDRHDKMKLRSIGYGYFMVNRTFEPIICEGCGAEVENPVRFINKRPYHKECFLNAGNKNS